MLFADGIAGRGIVEMSRSSMRRIMAALSGIDSTYQFVRLFEADDGVNSFGVVDADGIPWDVFFQGDMPASAGSDVNRPTTGSVEWLTLGLLSLGLLGARIRRFVRRQQCIKT